MKPSEFKVLTFVLFLKLHQGLQKLEDNPDDRAFKDLIQSALNLMPGYIAREGNVPGEVVVRRISKDSVEKSEEAIIKIQDAADSLKIIWNDYRLQMKKSN